MDRRVEAHGKRLIGLAALIAIYMVARLPGVDPDEQRAMAERFAFQSYALPTVAGPEVRSVRLVHPSLEHIASWISSVGAAVSLCDLDGDQLSNDVCYVDTRTDQVVVCPAPGTRQRYEPFTLSLASPLFDRETMCPTGCIPGDLNEDGLEDVLVYYWGRTPVAFLQKPTARGLARAEFVAREVVPGDARWFTNAATRADVDGDGHVDLVIGNYFQDGARILDADGDGIEHMQHSMSRAFNAGHNRLLLWQGGRGGHEPEVSFSDRPDVFTIDGQSVGDGWTLALAAADLDGDLLPELYVANDFGPDRLLHNRSTPGHPEFALTTGRRGFTTPSSKVIGKDSFKGMGVDFGDVNGDGHLDIYVSNIAAEYALEESHFLWIHEGEAGELREGRAPYVDRSETLGLARSSWGWDARLADFDNDGGLEAIQATGFVRGSVNRWPELHETAMGNDELLRFAAVWHNFRPGDDLSGNAPNPFFVRSTSGRFIDVAEAVGLGEPQVTRGIATADVDGDGDLDIALGNQWDDSRFYENVADGGAYLALRVLLPIPGERVGDTMVLSGNTRAPMPVCAAIGAFATVTHAGVQRVGLVDGGNGHSGTRSPEIHFGLSDAAFDDVVGVALRWRDFDGRARAEDFQLRPGSYTIVLGESGMLASRADVPASIARGVY